jgi:hypothetical protein
MKEVALLSNGDFRDPVGVVCWPKQEETLQQVEAVFKKVGVRAFRGNPFKPEKGHGFINTQAEACQICSRLPPQVPIVVVLSSWVWAHHLASSLKLHRGPILLLANFDGTWPGLVSLLNHAASYERMGIPHSRLWTDSFLKDGKFIDRLSGWIATGTIAYSLEHLTSLDKLRLPERARAVGQGLATTILKEKRILGQFDPGCMGMLNAVMGPDKLASIGMPVELLSQSDLLSEMALVSSREAEQTLEWLENRGASFHWGADEATELTRAQVLEQMKMYHAAGRIFERYGLAAIGIPYQYGLVRGTSASDLPEGMLNNCDRPAIHILQGKAGVNPGGPIVHFNEGDVGSGVPQVLMHDLLMRQDMATETTLHDVRWGIEWDGRFIWTLEISGGAPPEHFGGWQHTHVHRQTPMYFPKGGGTCSGVSKPGIITWARFYESFGEIGFDVGTGEIVELPPALLAKVRRATSEEWPIATALIPGYGRDELMSTHKANHITICYGNIAPELAATAAMLGIPVNVVGDARGLFDG